MAQTGRFLAGDRHHSYFCYFCGLGQGESGRLKLASYRKHFVPTQYMYVRTQHTTPCDGKGARREAGEWDPTAVSLVRSLPRSMGMRPAPYNDNIKKPDMLAPWWRGVGAAAAMSTCSCQHARTDYRTEPRGNAVGRPSRVSPPIPILCSPYSAAFRRRWEDKDSTWPVVINASDDRIGIV